MSYKEYFVDDYDYLYSHIENCVYGRSVSLSRARRWLSAIPDSHIIKVNGLYLVVRDIDFVKCAIKLYSDLNKFKEE